MNGVFTELYELVKHSYISEFYFNIRVFPWKESRAATITSSKYPHSISIDLGPTTKPIKPVLTSIRKGNYAKADKLLSLDEQCITLQKGDMRSAVYFEENEVTVKEGDFMLPQANNLQQTLMTMFDLMEERKPIHIGKDLPWYDQTEIMDSSLSQRGQYFFGNDSENIALVWLVSNVLGTGSEMNYTFKQYKDQSKNLCTCSFKRENLKLVIKASAPVDSQSKEIKNKETTDLGFLTDLVTLKRKLKVEIEVDNGSQPAKVRFVQGRRSPLCYVDHIGPLEKYIQYLPKELNISGVDRVVSGVERSKACMGGVLLESGFLHLSPKSVSPKESTRGSLRF